MTFGQNLARLRKEANLTQEELAQELGIAKSTVGNYERDHREPDIPMIFKLSEVLKVSGEEILGLPAPATAVETKKLPKDEERLLGSYRKLNDFGKQVARLNLDGMTKQSDYAILKSDKHSEFSKELA